VARATFPSRRDGWVVAITWLTVLPIAIALAFVFTAHDLTASWIFPTFLMVAAATLLLWVVYGTTYTINDELLRIRSGPFRWRVPLEDIVQAFPTDDPSASPACSLDRLHIAYGRDKSVLVSPARQDEFMTLLREKCPALKR
jgi:hypothetical protein